MVLLCFASAMLVRAVALLSVNVEAISAAKARLCVVLYEPAIRSLAVLNVMGLPSLFIVCLVDDRQKDMVPL